MADERERSSTTIPAVVAAIAVILPVLYVLSMGPVAKVIDRFGLDREPARTFYRPVIWLHDHTVLRRPLELYLGVWGVK